MGKGHGDWVCPVLTCSNLNFSKRDSCNRCGFNRSQGGGADAPLFRHRKYNDWLCEHCGNANWSRRRQCNICRQDRPGCNSDGPVQCAT
ncbi:Zn finger domain containing protein, putative [Babesia bigemina]|uniref:Zn finger domain containing protein, putative n=1 Tax=Babesia bigemina TaxID=5866 RepID=A0A061D835_BABBI|nr:Zn finger domain containing protein, putative [Babesia bigemina]CDR96157.1 Zn finger domain containing protein, putative [Babesia bigemina]|eukprot:XP_012768343.1 Zn finger domain containing protein, putative [Babesia bigemina]